MYFAFKFCFLQIKLIIKTRYRRIFIEFMRYLRADFLFNLASLSVLFMTNLGFFRITIKLFIKSRHVLANWKRSAREVIK